MSDVTTHPTIADVVAALETARATAQADARRLGSDGDRWSEATYHQGARDAYNQAAGLLRGILNTPTPQPTLAAQIATLADAIATSEQTEEPHEALFILLVEVARQYMASDHIDIDTALLGLRENLEMDTAGGAR